MGKIKSFMSLTLLLLKIANFVIKKRVQPLQGPYLIVNDINFDPFPLDDANFYYVKVQEKRKVYLWEIYS